MKNDEISDRDMFEDLLVSDVPPVKIGNTNKFGQCGMCGMYFPLLYPCRVGQVDFMICGYCKSIMDLGR